MNRTKAVALLVFALAVGCTDVNPAGVSAPRPQVVPLAADQSSDQITVTDLNVPGTWSQVIALNDQGQAGGNYRWDFNYEHGFFWDPATGLHEVAPLPGQNRVLVGDMNADGEVAATSTTVINGNVFSEMRGMIWSMATGSSALPLETASAVGINDLGQVAGTTKHNTFYRWSSETGLVDLGRPAGWPAVNVQDINNAGQVLISGFTGSGTSAAVWSEPGGFTILDPPAGVTGLSGFRISDTGLVVGTAVRDDGSVAAFYWTQQAGVVLMDTALGATGEYGFSAAYGVNATGTITGYASPSYDAFAWNESLGRVDLPRLDPCCNGFAFAINNTGQVGGEEYVTGWTSRAVIWNVPALAPTPLTRIAALTRQVTGLQDDGVLSKEEAERLHNKLDDAAQSVEDGKTKLAINHLTTFQNMVAALANSRRLTSEQADQLIHDAQVTIDQLAGF